MSKRKKKKGAASKSRRSAVKRFAMKIQSPVHSDGYKQDVLIDLYGGDRGVAGRTKDVAAATAGAAGGSYFKWQGDKKTYRVATTRDPRSGRTSYSAQIDTKNRAL